MLHTYVRAKKVAGASAGLLMRRRGRRKKGKREWKSEKDKK